MTALPNIPPMRLTPTEYFLLEQSAIDRHEYVDGKLLAMAGGTSQHSLIIANTIIAIGVELKGNPCRVYESNLRVGVKRKTIYCYPDLSIVCGAPEYEAADPLKSTVTNPKVLVEVVSESTEGYDRGDKFNRYREIESLEEYVLVSQRRAVVEVFRRQGEGTWIFQSFDGLHTAVKLASVGVSVNLSEIYAGVEFSPEATM